MPCARLKVTLFLVKITMHGLHPITTKPPGYASCKHQLHHRQPPKNQRLYPPPPTYLTSLHLAKPPCYPSLLPCHHLHTTVPSNLAHQHLPATVSTTKSQTVSHNTESMNLTSPSNQKCSNRRRRHLCQPRLPMPRGKPSLPPVTPRGRLKP